MERDIIIMSKKEAKRLYIVGKVESGKISQKEASEFLGISDRQVRRIVKRIREEGEKGVVHKSRGKAGNRAYKKGLKEKIIKEYEIKYKDFGPTLFKEKIEEKNKIKISEETLRKWLIASGNWRVKRKKKKHLRWRERKSHQGEMLQGDGSHHAWFEDRGSKCVLMAYIDDATNKVFARFYDYEGTKPAMDSLRKYSEENGLPNSIYMDNHSTYKAIRKASIEEELANKRPMSQFERAVDELGIKFIHAHSPQAKGRIERLFRTFQDRVIKEMRLKGVSNIKEGNEFLKTYLPKYNNRFSVPAKKQADLHLPLPSTDDLDAIFCIKTDRYLRNDNTISYKNVFYQILEKTSSKNVVVVEFFNGHIKIKFKDRLLDFKKIDAQLLSINNKKNKKFSDKHIPASNHPWRKFNINHRKVA